MNSQDAFDAALSSYLNSVSEFAREQFEERCLACESPIEEMMLAALMFLPKCPWAGLTDGFLVGGVHQLPLGLSQQHVIGRYRVDFAIYPLVAQELGVSTSPFKIVIECDGHQFHEKSKEQARRDRERDRELQRMGWRVLRFTGSEIYASAHECARQVQGLIESIFEDYYASLVAVIRAQSGGAS